MNLRSVPLLFAFMFTLSVSTAQDKKTLNITRAENPPKIDGILNEAIWANAEIATNFVEYEPNIGRIRDRSQRTEVKITYDDNAIYVGAYLYDDPEKMMEQLTSRDNFGQSDFFRVTLNPNNDSQNDTQFVVFSSGQQADAIANPSIGRDSGWNAVWQSAVTTMDDGWVVEMKIPYRTLRFADQEKPTWGLQLERQFRRERSRYTWNPIDPTKGYAGLYHGELKGLDGIEPPVRLNLYPFSTGIVNNFDGETDTDGLFSLETVACLGCCSLAPVLSINGKVFGNLDRKATMKILKEYKKQ